MGHHGTSETGLHNCRFQTLQQQNFFVFCHKFLKPRYDLSQVLGLSQDGLPQTVQISIELLSLRRCLNDKETNIFLTLTSLCHYAFCTCLEDFPRACFFLLKTCPLSSSNMRNETQTPTSYVKVWMRGKTANISEIVHVSIHLLLWNVRIENDESQECVHRLECT